MWKRLAAVLSLAAMPSAYAAEDLARIPLAGYAAPAVAPSPATAKNLEAWRAPDLRAGDGSRGRRSSPRCEDSGLDFCLGADGRITVPGAKRFLPAIPGLTPERLSVKRSGIVLGYSF